MPDRPLSSAAILGTGSFGTALARLLAPKLEQVVMIGRDPAVAESINASHHNSRYLAGIELPENIKASTSVGDARQATNSIRPGVSRRMLKGRSGPGGISTA